MTPSPMVNVSGVEVRLAEDRGDDLHDDVVHQRCHRSVERTPITTATQGRARCRETNARKSFINRTKLLPVSTRWTMNALPRCRSHPIEGSRGCGVPSGHCLHAREAIESGSRVRDPSEGRVRGVGRGRAPYAARAAGPLDWRGVLLQSARSDERVTSVAGRARVLREAFDDHGHALATADAHALHAVAARCRPRAR